MVFRFFSLDFENQNEEQTEIEREEDNGDYSWRMKKELFMAIKEKQQNTIEEEEDRQTDRQTDN